MSRSVLSIVVLACVVVTLAASCTQIRNLTDPDETVSHSTTVGENGFELVVNEFTISAPAGVAPAGSDVIVTTHSRDQFEDANRFTSREGNAVEIVLNDGEQPAQPIEVSMVLPEDPTSEEFSPLAVTNRQDGGLELVPTVYDPVRRSVSATMTHLSFLQFLRIDFAQIGSFMGDSITEFFGFGSDIAPDCVGESVELNGQTITADRAKNERGEEKNAAWPCLTISGNSVELSLESNSNLSWLTYTNPKTSPSHTIGSDSTEIGAQAIYRQLASGRERTAGYLTPDGIVRHTFPPGVVPELAGLRSSPALGLTATFLYMIDSVATLFGVDSKIATGAGSWDCLNGAADAADTNQKSLGESAGAMFKAQLDCLGTVATGPFGFFLGVLSGGIGIIVSSVNGVITEISGDARQLVDFEVEGALTTPTSGNRYFQSPTGNVQCQMGDGMAGTWGGGGISAPAVGCVTHEYIGPTVGVLCDTTTLSAVQGAAALGRSGEPVRTICTGGQPFSRSPSTEFPVLGYEQSVRWGTFTCSIDEVVGVTCTDSSSGNGFTISRDHVDLSGGDATRYTTSGADDSPMDSELGLFSDTFEVRGIKVTLLPDGTGTLYRNSGATDIATWPIVWEHTGTARARLVLGTPSLSSASASAVNDDFQVGATYDAEVQENPRVMILTGPVAGGGRDLPPLCPTDDRTGCAE